MDEGRSLILLLNIKDRQIFIKACRNKCKDYLNDFDLKSGIKNSQGRAKGEFPSQFANYKLFRNILFIVEKCLLLCSFGIASN